MIKEERYCRPNLPRKKVKRVLVSQLLPQDIVHELNDMGICTYKLGRTDNILSELAYHPDILVNNVREGLWLCESNAKYLPKDMPKDLRTSIFRESEVELGTLYPFDCPFNNFRLKRALVCGMSADHIIKSFADYDEHRIIYVKQNYTKCCCVIVNEEAVITSDIYIGKALRENGFDVLVVEDVDDIKLNGYSHGLIGGCSGKVSDNLIVFTGDLNLYRFGDDIRDFCRNYKVDCLSLSHKPLYDYGGILPVTEFI